MSERIANTNERFYNLEDGSQISIKAVLVFGQDNLYRGYIGSGTDSYVADYGNKLSYKEASIHFPNLPREKYANKW